jgi:hypothetical protein
VTTVPLGSAGSMVSWAPMIAARLRMMRRPMPRFVSGRAGITWRGIEILRRESGVPYIRLRDEALELATDMGITDWFISIRGSSQTTDFQLDTSFGAFARGIHSGPEARRARGYAPPD